MDTISINAGQVSGEEKKGKEKAKMSDGAKAAMATGAAGLAAGMAGKAIYDDIVNDPDPEPVAQNHAESSEAMADLTDAENLDQTVYVNPDEVMIEEEPMVELTEDDNFPVDVDIEIEDYRPLAENDPIDVTEEDPIIEPFSEEEILLADNQEVLDVEPIYEDNTIDVICGTTDEDVTDPIDVLYTPEGDILADNTDEMSDFNDIDVQSDLMA